MPNGETVPEEAFFQSRVKHPAIIELLGHFWHDGSSVMVMEKPEVPCDLADYLVENNLIGEDEARGIFRKVGGTVRRKGRTGKNPRVRWWRKRVGRGS